MIFLANSIFIAVPNLAASLVLLALLTGNWRRRQLPGAIHLIALQCAAFVWNTGEFLVLLSGDRPTITMAQLFLDVGAYTIPSAALFMALHLSAQPQWTRLLFRAILFGLPVSAVLTFVAGLPWLYRSIDFVGLEGEPHLVIDYGPLVVPLLIFVNLCLALAAVLSGRELWRGGYAQKLRAGVLLAAVVTPWVLFAIETQIPSHRVGFSAIGAAVVLGVLEAVDRRFSSIDISPLARELVVESMPDAMVVTTLEGRVTDYNEAAERLLGLDRSSLGVPVETALGHWQFSRNGVFPAEIQRARTLLVSRTTIRRGPEPIGEVFIARDITETKRIEAELREATKTAQAAVRLQSEFLANMSHEIRTPLNGILGMNNLLLDTELNNDQGEYARILRHSAESLRVIVDDVLDFSKIEAGLLTVEHVPLDLRQLLGDTCLLFDASGREKGLSVEYSFEDSFPPRILGDPTRLRQVAANLISNAIKFTSEGRVSISLRRDGAEWYEIVVADSGIGFEPAMAERIFERFVQADSSTTRRHGGTGLGLSISRKLMQFMGGSIHASASPGKGATFTLRLPMVEAGLGSVGKEELDTAPEPVCRPGARVLLVEDNLTNQKLVSTLLNKIGCEVGLASDGEAACCMVEEAADHCWDLILMDCFMPGVDGYVAAERIRTYERENGKQRVPIVAITASVLDSDRSRCFASGMDQVLPKPIVFNDLKRTVALRTALPSNSAEKILN